jgi:rod shape-determining protein MreD
MTKQLLRWTGLIILMYVLQTTIVPVVAIYGIKPDLLMLVLFFCAFRTDVIPAVFAGFFIGLAQDFYSPIILGQNALAKTIAGFFAGFFNQKVMRIDPLFQLLLILLMFIIHDAVIFAVQVAKTDTPLPAVALQLVTFTLPRAIYTLFFALVPTFWEYIFPSGIRR